LGQLYPRHNLLSDGKELFRGRLPWGMLEDGF
jgi:hypothetical protein